MDENEPVIIVNPNCFTYQKEDAVVGQQLDTIIEEDKVDESIMDFVAQQAANFEIQKQLNMANRDKSQKSRIEWQKANGTYKSNKFD